MNRTFHGASSYKKVCEYYNCLVIGFTGSPIRSDGKPLDLFDELVIGISAEELIKKGAISDYDYYAPNLDIDFSDLRKFSGDYNVSQLEEKMTGKKIYGDILKYYNMLGQGRQAIAYCVNVSHSKEMTDLFNSNGISAIHMDAKTPEDERLKILKEYKEGKYQVLCNCNLISEGITLPSCEVGLLLRKTASTALYIQQSMRCLTPVEGKKAIIIDYVGNIFEHGMPSAERDWSLKTKVQEYINENDNGTFMIRTCPECFMVFQNKGNTNICPYCGAEYKLDPIEIKNIKEIELKKVEEAKAARMQKLRETVQNKVRDYESPKECKSWMELVQYCKVNNYKPGYAYFLNSKLKLNFKIGGK